MGPTKGLTANTKGQQAGHQGFTGIYKVSLLHSGEDLQLHTEALNSCDYSVILSQHMLQVL